MTSINCIQQTPLPKEIISFFFQDCTPKELGIRRRVCKEWENVIECYSWKILFYNRKGQAFINFADLNLLKPKNFIVFDQEITQAFQTEVKINKSKINTIKNVEKINLENLNERIISFYIKEKKSPYYYYQLPLTYKEQLLKICCIQEKTQWDLLINNIAKILYECPSYYQAIIPKPPSPHSIQLYEKTDYNTQTENRKKLMDKYEVINIFSHNQLIMINSKKQTNYRALLEFIEPPF